MLLSEPSRTSYDWNFVLFGFPVRVHPAFLLMVFFLGAGALSHPRINAGLILLMLVLIFFVSILVHELGHAFAFRHFGRACRIVIYWMGGLAIPDAPTNVWQSQPQGLGPNQHIVVSLAGPFAGFALAALIVAGIYATGGSVSVERTQLLPVLQPDMSGSVLTRVDRLTTDGESSEYNIRTDLEQSGLSVLLNGERVPMDELSRRGESTLVFLAGPPPAGATLDVHVPNEFMQMFLWIALWFNIFINLINLLPVFPLDGGQVARQLFVQSDPLNGIRYSLMLSVIVGGLVAVVCFFNQDQFIAIFFAILAFSNYMTMQQMLGGGRSW